VKPRREISVNGEDWEYSEYLVCWTTLAVFCVTGEIASLGEHGRNWRTGVNLAMSISNEDWVGSIMMNQVWVAEHLMETRCLEFILLSRSRGIRQTTIQPHPTYLDQEKFDNKLLCMLNVMLIEWERDSATRLGVGIINEDA